ncbi:MAG TPA: hypothetical protein PLO37_02825 [Candidatus Hydrogenedentes bacterium]|nr:hypothetical protein [Candidatus Hydrogenedentota bacterium]HPG65754.1 hypothetical protein [Candidatus Hydrogenedentota bacterium]
MKSLAMAMGMLVLLLSACKPMDDQKRDLSSTTGLRSVLETKTVEIPADISRVEFSVNLKVILDPRSAGPNVASEELVNARYLLDMCTITVKPPHPDELWLMLKYTSQEDFGRTPVVLRTKVFADEKVIDEYTTIIGAGAQREVYERSLELRTKLGEVPETVLIRAQADALLLPEDTDPLSIDPETVTVTPDRMGVVLSNPARINFVAEDGLSGDAAEAQP